MKSVHVVGVIAACATTAQLVLIGWSTATGGSVITALTTMAETPWGLTTIVDLYLGLLVVGLWISLLERSLWRAAPWWLGLFLLGNLTTAAYVAWRCFTRATLRDALLRQQA